MGSISKDGILAVGDRHFSFGVNLEFPTFSESFMGHVSPLRSTFSMFKIISLSGDDIVHVFSNIFTSGLDLDA